MKNPMAEARGFLAGILVIFCGFFAVHLSSIILRPGSMFGDGTRYDTMRIMRHTCIWVTR